MSDTTVLLQPVGIVHTPQNLEELDNYIALFNGSERTVAFTCAYMAWNLCAKLTNPEGRKADEKL
jgi:hypothetical protein